MAEDILFVWEDWDFGAGMKGDRVVGVYGGSFIIIVVEGIFVN